MHNGVVTNVRMTSGNTSGFSITISLHQEFALSLYLFALVMNELIEHIQDDIPQCANDIFIVHKPKIKINHKLELWRTILESKGFRLSGTKMECILIKFEIMMKVV